VDAVAVDRAAVLHAVLLPWVGEVGLSEADTGGCVGLLARVDTSGNVVVARTVVSVVTVLVGCTRGGYVCVSSIGSRVSAELLRAAANSSNEGVASADTLLLTQYDTRLASFLHRTSSAYTQLLRPIGRK